MAHLSSRAGNRSPKIRPSPGFTLVEAMVAMSLLTLVFLLGSEFIIRGLKSMSFSSEQETAIQNARKISEVITNEIRETIYSDRGDYPLNTIDGQVLILYTDQDSDGEIEKVRYFLEDHSFKRGVTEPGALLDYSSTEIISNLADYINNQAEPLFHYFDSNYSTSTVINNIRLIKTRLKVNVNPAIAPQDYYLESDIQLRNLKDNL